MRFLLLCAFSLLAACQTTHQVTPPPAPIAQGRDHADLGVIRELATGRTLTPQELVERLALRRVFWSVNSTTTRTTTPCNCGCCASWRHNAPRAAC